MTTQVKSSVIANSGVTAKTYGNSSNVVSFAVGSDGRITSATNTAISIGASAISSGTLAIAQGGTNSSTTPTSGAVAYGTGSAIGYTAAGSSGQYLQSNGSSAPSWSTVCTSPPTTYGAVGTYVIALNHAGRGTPCSTPQYTPGTTVSGACLYYADWGAAKALNTIAQTIAGDYFPGFMRGGQGGVCSSSSVSSLGLSGTWRQLSYSKPSNNGDNPLAFFVRVS
jgi:hypothetical protein